MKKTPLIIGGIIPSVSIPILTSVTAPAKVVQVSPASSSPTLTTLAREGKTNGVFFRTITSDEEDAVDHRRHHPLGLDPDPHLGDRAGQGRAGLAGFLLADTDHARPR